VGLKNNHLSVEIYSIPGCSFCVRLKEKVLPELAKKYVVGIKIISFELDNPKNYEHLVEIEKQYHVTLNALPVVLIGGNILGGQKEINNKLENLFVEALRYPNRETLPAVSDSRSIKKELETHIRSLSFVPIFAAAFIDGINPCAFAGIVFLVSCIGMINRRPLREVFLTGITYILGIFFVYFLIGIGLSRALLAISSLTGVTRIIYILAGTITIVLSLISFYDWHTLRTRAEGSQNKIILQLPTVFKVKIRSIISKYGNMKFIVPFGFCLGAIVSILEFFCTGQIYLPTIMYMVRMPELKSRALFFLGIYSFVFVLPLIIILITIIAGLKTGRVKVFGEGGTKLVKLSTGIILMLLSIFIFMFSF
jgi:glutaredoxin